MWSATVSHILYLTQYTTNTAYVFDVINVQNTTVFHYDKIYSFSKHAVLLIFDITKQKLRNFDATN